MTSPIRLAQDVLDFWIGDARHSAEAARARNKLWFVKSDLTDANIRNRYSGLPDLLMSGVAINWANDGASGRLAAIIALDQFPRNMFRGSSRAFDYDGLALKLTKAGIQAGHDTSLSEVERKFFYLPLEHSEDPADQVLCVRMYEQLCGDCRSEFKEICESALDYARQHKAVIDQFGRYPHRNAVLSRASTPEEIAFIETPGSGF